MIVYFSGTGNSRRCAEQLAELLQDEMVDAFGYIQSAIAADLISGKPWVFVSPTYAWRLPRVFESFIRSGSFSGNRNAYFVMTCGEDIGNAAESIRVLCRDVNLQDCGVMPIVMPENYIAMFDVPDEARSAEILAAARPVVRQAASYIAQSMAFPEQEPNLSDRLKSGLINRVFYPVFVKANAFYAKESCVGCEACVNHCVLGNISLHNGRPVWGENCTHCMACICGCPTEAIEYGKKTRGKRRYWCK